MKFIIHIFLYLLIITSTFLLPFESIQSIIIIAAATAIFIAVLIWATVNINSQFFIKTICRGNSKDKVAITFDDGPDSDNTINILEVLDDYDAKATFFIIGEKAEENHGLVKLISNSGHLLGNHSYSHKKFFPLMSACKIRNEIAKTQSIIENITGKPALYFRPPFGISNPLLASALKRMNLKTIGWSIRAFDTVNKNPDKIIKRIKKRLKGGEIILLHDNSGNIVKILKELMEIISKMGLKAVRVDELINT